MERYARARIYKIVGGGKTYYGSTCETMSRRLSQHKSLYKMYSEGRSPYVTAYDILNEPDYHIVLVEEYPCDNRDQLRARERFWIENNECVNKFIPTRTVKERQQTDKYKDYHKEYEELNKEKRAIQHKANYEANKDYYKKKRRERYLRDKQKTT